MGLLPLTARSVLLSLLLGSHPPRLAVRTLVMVAELFGIADGTVRVALSRMAADGEVKAEEGNYQLSERLVERQRRQDESRRPPRRPWDGGWELAVIRPGGRAEAQRSTLGDRLRLAELTSGIWLRPHNLERSWPAELLKDWRRLTGRPDGDPVELATELWDLTGWAAQGEALLSAMADAQTPARRFTLSAAILRHLGRDPLLPDALIPLDWPGDRLRNAYHRFEAELATLLRMTPTA